MSKRIEIENKRFGLCVVKKQASYSNNNNTKYHCSCDCGREFITYGILLRNGQVDRCRDCRKKKYRLKLKAVKVPTTPGVKYTLMNLTKTEIIKGENGIHIYFSKLKAKIASRIMNAVVVELKEAIQLSYVNI